MKKNLLLAISLILTFALFVGCSGQNQAESGPSEESETTEAIAEDTNSDETQDEAPEETEVLEDETSEDSQVGEDIEIEEVDTRTVYVSPQWVHGVINGEVEGYEDYVIGEVSWGEVEDSPTYMTGHIPGAIHINTDSVEEGPVWNYKAPEEVVQGMLDYGIDKDTKVILYGNASSAEARIAQAYLWIGVEDVKVLDGGLEAYKALGYELETQENLPVAKEDFGVEVPVHPEYILSIDEVKEKLQTDENFKLVSVRSWEEYIGETSGYSYIPKAGEPEGALWGEDEPSYFNEDKTVKTVDEMNEFWNEHGFDKNDEISFYCGTGWRVSVPWLVMYQEGYEGMTLFDGGWNEWQMDDSNPVQVGDPESPDVVYTTVGELSNDKATE